MLPVFVHTYDAPGSLPVNQSCEFLRVPIVGEYFALDTSGPWYEVTLVVHCPNGPQYGAEVYGRKVDDAKVLHDGGSWRKGRGPVVPPE
jgi:hypothetical protein